MSPKEGPPPDDAEIYLNTVSTFGISTAGYYWDPSAAMIVRGTRYLIGPANQIRILLFADDGKRDIPPPHVPDCDTHDARFLCCDKNPCKITMSKRWMGVPMDWILDLPRRIQRRNIHSQEGLFDQMDRRFIGRKRDSGRLR